MLISNTYHSVRGQLLAERQGETQRERVVVRLAMGGCLGGVGALRPLIPLYPPGGDRGELRERLKRPATEGG